MLRDAGPAHVARLLFRVSSTGGSGALRIEATGVTARVGLDSGWVHALTSGLRGPAPLNLREGDGPGRLTALLGVLPEDARADLDATVRRDAMSGRVPPFHPARALRSYFERVIERDGAEAMHGDARVRLHFRPHGSAVDPDEAVLLGVLDVRRYVRDLGRLAIGDRPARLLGFLRAAGALEFDDPARLAALRTLGLEDDTDRDEVRRAYHRIARSLHPDLHPAGSPDHAQREARLREVNAAYRLLGEAPADRSTNG